MSNLLNTRRVQITVRKIPFYNKLIFSQTSMVVYSFHQEGWICIGNRMGPSKIKD